MGSYIKILQYNETGSRKGGASEIFYLLKEGFEKFGHKVYNISPDNHSDTCLPQVSSVGEQVRFNRQFELSLNDTEDTTYTRLRLIIKRLKIDKVIFHNNKFSGVSVETIAKLSLEIPVYVVTHDLAYITGGCSNPTNGCERFLKGCYSCPLLGGEPVRKVDRSSDIWKFKHEWLRKSRITFICTSDWAYNHFNKALSLTNNKVKLIYNGVDSDAFKFNFKTIARDKLGLPNDRKILLYAANGGSDSPFRCKKSLEAVEKYFLSEQNTLLISIGNFEEKITDDRIELGYISDKKLLNLYFSAANLAVYPSLAETSPLFLRQVILSGTFFASYAVGGIPELTYNGKFGYVSSRGDIQGLIDCVEEGLYKTISPKDADVHEFKASTMIENYLKLLS